MLFLVVLCILLFYKLSQKETFQDSSESSNGSSDIQYRYRPTSWVNESDYEDIKDKFINDLTSTRPVTEDNKTLSDLVKQSLQGEGLNVNNKLGDLQNSINRLQILNQKSSGFLNNIDHLGKFQDNYSNKLESILESKYQGTIDNNFNLKQKIAENKIKAIEDILSGIQETISEETPSLIFKSIRCLDNDLSLNVQSVANNGITNKDGLYMIYINNNVLFYELLNNDGAICSSNMNNCKFRPTDGSENDISFDTEFNTYLKDAYFKIILISDYNDYNTHIDAHKEANMKKYVYETDDINYPFYIIQPDSHPGLCLNLESGELGEFNIRIKPCSNNKTERFEALLYETFNGCNSEPTTISQ